MCDKAHENTRLFDRAIAAAAWDWETEKGMICSFWVTIKESLHSDMSRFQMLPDCNNNAFSRDIEKWCASAHVLVSAMSTPPILDWSVGWKMIEIIKFAHSVALIRSEISRCKPWVIDSPFQNEILAVSSSKARIGLLQSHPVTVNQRDGDGYRPLENRVTKWS